MRKKMIAGMMLTLTLSVMGMLTEAFDLKLWLADSPVRNVYAGWSYGSIQEAINEASPGDIIHVPSGNYVENVVVNKTVMLIGNGSSTTVIDGGGSDAVVTVTANCVFISDFTIRNGSEGVSITESAGSHVSRNIITLNKQKGVKLEYCDHNDIVNNTIISNQGEGVYVAYSNGTLACGNRIDSNNGYGVEIQHSSYASVANNTLASNKGGIHIYGSAHHNAILGNNILARAREGDGIYVEHDYPHPYPSNNTIASNMINSSRNGINFYFASNNTISSNLISHNDPDGIKLRYSPSNVIQNNVMKSNRFSGIFIQHSDYASITGNVCNASFIGIYILLSNSCAIIGNVLTSNDGAGVDADGSYSNIISQNEMVDNFFGIYLDDDYGLCSDNKIYHNIVMSYEFNAVARAGPNSWDNGTHGNFWSDYTGDGHYNISWPENVDYHPLILVPYSITTEPLRPEMKKNYTLLVNLTNTLADPVYLTGVNQVDARPREEDVSWLLNNTLWSSSPGGTIPAGESRVFEFNFTNEWQWIEPLNWKSIIDILLCFVPGGKIATLVAGWSTVRFIEALVGLNEAVPEMTYTIGPLGGSDPFIIFSADVAVEVSIIKKGFLYASAVAGATALGATLASIFFPPAAAYAAHATMISMVFYAAATDPDPNYCQIATIEPISIPEEIEELPEGPTKRLAIAQLDLASIEKAHCTSHTRYEAAKEAGNKTCMELQLQATMKYNNMATKKMEEVQFLTCIVTTDMEPLKKTQLTEAWNQINATGLPPSMQDILIDAGYNSSQIYEITQAILEATNTTELREAYKNPADWAKQAQAGIQTHYIEDYGLQVTAETENLTVQPVHDVAITDVWPSAAGVYVGEPVDINVKVKNYGNATEENFGVTAYANTTVIERRIVNNLPPGEEATLTFCWDTTVMSPDYYRIKAVADNVTGETFTADNLYVDGTVKLTYDVTIQAYCYTEDTPVNVNIAMDGSPTGYNTPHAFTDLTRTHTFTVPTKDPNGHLFKQWSTGETSRTITVNTGGTYTAYYQAKYTLTITATTGGTTNPSSGTHSYWDGTSVDVTAIPDTCYMLHHWELDGDPAGSANPYPVLMDDNHTLHAIFALINYTLAVTATPSGTTVPALGTHTYTCGSSVEVTAFPDFDYMFDHWELDGSWKYSNPISVTMDSDHTLHTVFTYNVTIKAHCLTEDEDIIVCIRMDGSPTEYHSPHTFTVVGGTHTFRVPKRDPHEHPFKQWNTGETSTTIAVTSPGAYTAYYEELPPPSPPEEFGPRADRLLIKLYDSAEPEWDALEAGEIDITDWPLTDAYYDRFTGPTQDADVETMYYGTEFSLFLLDINWNNNPYLGNPQEDLTYPNPDYPNPVYPNPTSCLNMRQALWHLTDRDTWGDTYIGRDFCEDFHYPLQTVVPPCYGACHKSIANPYPYSREDAIVKLESDICPEDGMPDFPLNPGTGWRYWDMNGNGVEDPDEYLELKFVIRTDHYHRKAWGNALANELEAIGVRVDRMYSAQHHAIVHVMINKDFHLYTGGWSLGVNPDYLMIWNSFYHWHPGFCHNYAFINDEILDDASWNVYYADTEDEALTNCLAFQHRFAEVAAAVPWWSYDGSKAVRRRYTGGTDEALNGETPEEDPYKGEYWDGIVNVPGYGIDNYWSFLNMHPRGFERGDCEHMTIRYGFSTPEITSFNPLYATKEHEWKILGLIYDTLLKRNPYNHSELMPWLASNYEVGTYWHPIFGKCTKVAFTLRPDAYWADGTPLTTADVYFTFVELDDILMSRGYPPPWWYPNVMNILEFQICDAYNFEVLFNVESIYVAGWLGDQIEMAYHKWPWGTPILPKHIWKPIAESGGVTGTAPDPNMIGSGPWRFKEYLPYSHVLMVANKPGSTVTTSHSGSTQIASPHGYWRYSPIIGDLTVDGTLDRKIDCYTQPHTINFTVTNEWYGGPITIDLSIKMTFANGTIFEDAVTDISLNTKGTPGDNYSYTKSDVMDGTVKIEFTIEIKDPPELAGGGVFRISIILWSTIKQDIAGSTFYDDIDLPDYPYKMELPTPDFKVDIKDIAMAARAFGSYPGHRRWCTVCDINSDYKIDIKDVAGIARKFGWIKK